MQKQIDVTTTPWQAWSWVAAVWRVRKGLPEFDVEVLQFAVNAVGYVHQRSIVSGRGL